MGWRHALGYGAAGIFELPAKERDKRLLRIGIGLIVAFIVIRALNVYGDPNAWESDPGSMQRRSCPFSVRPNTRRVFSIC